MSVKEETPWKNGYYYNESHTPNIQKVNGHNCETRKIVSFDFPEIDMASHGIWTFGEFGPACKEVEEASGKIFEDFNTS